jgi:hypothetical protein
MWSACLRHSLTTHHLPECREGEEAAINEVDDTLLAEVAFDPVITKPRS